jgi:hypothetical protein
MRIARIVRPASSKTALATFGLGAPTTNASLAAGGVYDVDLEIITDHPVERVAIGDALPAGLEAVDATFATTSAALGTPSASWAIGDRQIYTDRIEAYADTLAAGIYDLHYLARRHARHLCLAGCRRPPDRQPRRIRSQRGGDRRREVNAATR